MPTPHHAKYFAHDLTIQKPLDGVERISRSLFDACVDLNPHQIDAALFALRSPLSKGVILADEVGLGKTIEAGLLLCQFWAEQKRRIIVVCPASLRKQWGLELSEKFNLPGMIMDAKAYRQERSSGNIAPFEQDQVIITSFHYASRMKEELRAVNWDVVVIDEAHKLRNAYRASNKMGQNLRWAFEDKYKILMTATPLQNSLLELYGLSTFLDEYMFGEISSFRSNFMNSGGDVQGLRERLKPICKRTLRKDVLEYIQYTERRPIAFTFRSTDEEQRLYDAVSDFLKRDDTYSFPKQQRQLITLIMRKLLASSSQALLGTLQTMKKRLQDIKEGVETEKDLTTRLMAEEELEDEFLEEEFLELETEDSLDDEIDLVKLEQEISELDMFISWASNIQIDTKTKTLLKALESGFSEMKKMGASRRALIFTESRRTQDYLKRFLESNGYANRVVTFNGTNSDQDSKAIYESWLEKNASTGRSSGSRPIDVRTALIEHFRDNAQIMIATEAGAEGVNLQFCSLVINYDLPWNPQRIEQRIGRCHRYGQAHDVVVINFLNERNAADQRVYELLEQKFNLFNGVFGSSDAVLGSIESGVDFEKRILSIYQSCRTSEEIAQAFEILQKELEEQISDKLEKTRQLILDHFDEDVHTRLRVQLNDAQSQLDIFGKRFWTLSQFILQSHACFDDQALSFSLNPSPIQKARPGTYHLISKDKQNIPGEYLFRPSHPLGEYVIEQGKNCHTPEALVRFDISGHPTRISIVEQLKGKSGWMNLSLLTIESFRKEEYLLFSGFDTMGKPLNQETCVKLFNCSAQVLHDKFILPHDFKKNLSDDVTRHAQATISRSLEENNKFFHEERERLERWADDMVQASERELADTKAQIKALNRQARMATTIQEQKDIQTKIAELEKLKRKQRSRIFEVEDEIEEKRDQMISMLEKRLKRKTSIAHLFTVQWEVV
ncbi:SNF2-related protein [Desulfonatronovibrio magnus]|uniref:SNF2-related protein n=1 Tax=Desulfonatronovibrio magnus TaxID=698827 RepID=UPI0005EB41A9|nr:SNF2-related protein [Desulfonatronovibrio magnus]